MHSEPVGTTTASLIAPLPTNRDVPWAVWISFATPCTGIFVPVYLDSVLPPAFARGSETPGADSAWWTFKQLQDVASTDFPRWTPWLRDAWAPLESQIEGERREVETRARNARGGDAAAQVLSEFMARTAEQVLKQAELLRQRIESGA